MATIKQAWKTGKAAKPRSKEMKAAVRTKRAAMHLSRKAGSSLNAVTKGRQRASAHEAQSEAITSSRKEQAHDGHGFRAGSKGDTILGLLRRPGGATVLDLIKATGWQAHSVRGFLSGTLRKRLGLPVASEKGDEGVRRYWIAS